MPGSVSTSPSCRPNATKRSEVSSTTMPETLWKLSHVRTKGLYHFVSHVHAYIDATELAAVGKRLELAFQAASVHCDYGSLANQSKLYCRTLESIDFVVALWKLLPDQDTNNDNVHGSTAVLIELNPTVGDCIPFHALYIPLVMNAIRGTTACVTPVSNVSTSSMTSTPTWWGCHGTAERPTTSTPGPMYHAMDMLFEIRPAETLLHCSKDDDDDDMQLLASELNRISDQLSSPRYDMKHQALETLSRLIDPTITMPRVVTTVSRILVAGSSFINTGTSSDTVARLRNDSIHQSVLRLAMTQRLEAASSNEILSAHAYVALMLVAQAMSRVYTEDIIQFVLSTEQVLTGGFDSMVRVLTDLIQTSSDLPHVAYWATRILTALVAAGSLGHTNHEHDFSVPTIQHANAVGTCRHSALAQASHQLLSQLSSAAVAH